MASKKTGAVLKELEALITEDKSKLSELLKLRASVETQNEVIAKLIAEGKITVNDVLEFLPSMANDSRLWAEVIKADPSQINNLPAEFKTRKGLAKQILSVIDPKDAHVMSFFTQEIQNELGYKGGVTLKDIERFVKSQQRPKEITTPIYVTKVSRTEKLEEAHKKQQAEFDKRVEEFKKLSDNNPVMSFINRFLALKLPKEVFESKQPKVGIKWKDIEGPLSVARPDLTADIARHEEDVHDKYYEDLARITKDLLSGDLSFYQFAKTNDTGVKIEDIVTYIADKESLRNFDEKILKALSEGKLTFKDYYRMFAYECTYDMVDPKTEVFFRALGRRNSDLQKRGGPIDAAKDKTRVVLQDARVPYSESNFLGKTLTISDISTGRTAPIVITVELLDAVLDYLDENDEYICDKTVKAALEKFLSGKIKLNLTTDKAIAEFEGSKKELDALNEKIASLERQSANGIAEESPDKQDKPERRGAEGIQR